MPEGPQRDPVDDGSREIQPASSEDVAEAREQDDVLGSSPRTSSDRSLTGETHPRPDEDEEQSRGTTGDG